MMGNILSGIVTSVMIDDTAFNPIVTSGNIRLDKATQQGMPVYQLFINQSNDLVEELSNRAVLDVLENDVTILGNTITINRRVLDNPEILQAIQNNLNNHHLKAVIRISDEGYTLTREDYNKLPFANIIVVDNCVPELASAGNILSQRGVFKYETQSAVQPVLERRTHFDELVARNAFHITHPLSEEEFQYLAQFIDSFDSASIELDYYDPNYYREFLNQLQQHVHKTDIHIQLLGYLLEDQLTTFMDLEQYPYEIDVVYSTCHDMIDEYQREPYTANRLYRSSIEGGGITSLGNYLNVLEEVTTFESLASHLDLSPLETAVLAKMMIDGSYIYDPDYQNPNRDEWDNTNLSQMLHHEVDGRKRAVCLGFSTLYSAYLRRSNIPMFRYSTTKHNRNIGRIKDDKYGVDTICATDITWDLPDQNGGINSYNHFMVAPREMMRLTDNDGNHELLTLADTLSLSMEDCNAYLPYTNDSYEQFFHPFYYDPRGYAGRFLELTGVAPEDQDLDFYDVVYRLCEEHRLEGIPQETIDRAIDSVIQKMGFSEEYRENYHALIDFTRGMRDTIFAEEPALYGVDVNDPTKTRNYPVNVLTPENVRERRRELWESGSERLIYPSANRRRNPENHHTDTPQEERTETPTPVVGEDYVHQLIRYCQENNVSIYNYYRNVGRYNRGEQSDAIPSFEAENPFITADDYALLQQSEDRLIVHYFANAMMRVISLNLTDNEKSQYDGLFSREEDTYVEALIEETNERMERNQREIIQRTHHTPTDNREEERQNELEEMFEHGDEFIPGTNIYKPRDRGIYESDEEYVAYLRDYYNYHFPNANTPEGMSR